MNRTDQSDGWTVIVIIAVCVIAMLVWGFSAEDVAPVRK